MDGIGVEERYPGVENASKSEKESDKEEKAYDEELLKEISDESFLVKLLDDRTDVNVKQNMMRDVNALDDETIRSVLRDFECPNEPTIIKGVRGTPDCDGTQVCSIAKASLKDMKITKKECEELKNALVKPDPEKDPARFRRVLPSLGLLTGISRHVAIMLSRAISGHAMRHVPDVAREMQEMHERHEEKRQRQQGVIDTDLVSVYLLDYDGCSDAVSPYNRRYLDPGHHDGLVNRFGDKILALREEFFLNLEALRGSRVISFCASARQGKTMDVSNAENNGNGYALGSAKRLKHQYSAFEAMSSRYEFTLNKATMSDFRDATHFNACEHNWNDDQCRVDGDQWDDQYEEGDPNDWYAPPPYTWGRRGLGFDERIKVSIAENTLRALGRMSPEDGGLTDEEKARGVNVIFFDDKGEYLESVRTYARIPENLGFQVNFFTLHFDPDVVIRGRKANKLMRFGDRVPRQYDIEYLRTDDVRRRARANMGKQEESTKMKRTKTYRDLGPLLRANGANGGGK